MKGSGFGFDDLWGEGADASPLISEVATEKALSAQVKAVAAASAPPSSNYLVRRTTCTHSMHGVWD